MASPTCTVNAASTTYGAIVNFNTTATIQLANTTGVTTWSLTVVGTDEITTSSNYTLTITDVYNKTATLVTPLTDYSIRLQSVINGGLNNGVFDPNYITTFIVYKSSNSNTVRLLTNGETLETHPTHGYVKVLNDLIRNKISSSKAIKIIAIGDSHTNGTMAAVTVAGSEVMFPYAGNSPKDRQWNGTNWNTFFKMDSQINVETDTSDPNCSVGVNKASFLPWLPRMLRDYTSNFIDIANLGVGGSSFFTWSGQQASGYIQFTAAPNDGDTVTIGSTVYRFKTTPDQAFDVLINATANNNAINLANAINAEGTGWYAGTTLHPTFYAPNNTATTHLRLNSVLTGTASNSTVFSVSAGGRILVYQQPSVAPGSDTSALITNGLAALNGGTGFGTPDIVMMTLGTNDAARIGYRGRCTQVEMTKLIVKIKTLYPTAKIIVSKPPVYASQASLASTVLPAINAVIAADSSLYVADLNGLGTGTAQSGIISNDGVHLSDYGYYCAAQLFTRQIVSALSLT